LSHKIGMNWSCGTVSVQSVVNSHFIFSFCYFKIKL
jgi:hypothetical protein